MTATRFACMLLLALSTSATLTSRALADEAADRATARDLAQQAQDALEQKDFPRARELFGRAYSMVPLPTLSLGMARADVGLGRLVLAHERLLSIVRDGAPADAKDAIKHAVEDAGRDAAALKPRLAGLVLTVRGVSGASLTLDGETYPDAALGVRRAVDPGKHLVRASAPGAKPTEQSFTVTEGATADVSLELALELSANPSEKPSGAPRGAATSETSSMSTLRIVGFVVGGAGVASLGAAAVTGGLYLDRKGTVDERCTASLACDAEGLDAARAAETLALVNTVTFFGGLALAGLGTTLIILGPDEPDAPHVGVGASTTGFGVTFGGAL